MDKKEIFVNAANATQRKKPNRVKRALSRIEMQFNALWAWMRRRDKLVFFNIMLLAIICAMLFIMFGNVKKQTKLSSAQTPRISSASVPLNPKRPTIIISRTGAMIVKARTAPVMRQKQIIITLPLKRGRAAGPAPKTTRITGDIIIDGRRAAAKLAPMTSISGNLILQNMRAYTLPCGVMINGNLFLRDVKLLKFCAPRWRGVPSFGVKGNIYVSSNSSFGPIPKNAHLGGQVIF